MHSAGRRRRDVVIVNGVDTARLDEAARHLRTSAAAEVTLRLSAAQVASWLATVSLVTERSRLGELILGLPLADQVAEQVLAGDTGPRRR